MNIYVKDIIKLCDGRILCGKEDIELSSFCTDSRCIKKGDVYVGIKGENNNGNLFYQDAINKGASVCILNRGDYNTSMDCTIVLVDDTIKCLQELAKYRRSLSSSIVVAVTGSVGKTSTKDIIASVLSTKYKTHKTSGNYNNHIGVPLTILGMNNDDEVLVVEMGMNHFNEISLLSNIAKPDISVITNIGTAHIGNLGSRENILKAKLEILDGMIGKKVILNSDDDMLASVVNKLKESYDVSTISINNNSTYKAVNVDFKVFSSCFDIAPYCSNVEIDVGGTAYVYNALTAYAVGKHLNISDENIKLGIKNFKLSSSRLEKKIMTNGAIIIDDTYNANYDSMKSSIELLGRVNNKRKIAILGDMLELGEYTKTFHKNLGDVIADEKIDILITIGKFTLNIEKRLQELGWDNSRLYHFEKESDSYKFLTNFIKDNDIILLKGSHGIHLIGIVNYLMSL